MPSGTQPRWVQTPSVISQFALPGLVRSASDWGSRSSERLTAFASAISFGVRLRMNIGCLRHWVLMPWPGWILEMSTSVVDSANTSADGLIWTISGASAATVPTPAKLTAATLRKSRRRTPLGTPSPPVSPVTPADAFVAIIPLLALILWTCPEGIKRRRPDWAPARLAGLIARHIPPAKAGIQAILQQ